jgi:hypothetical protein
MLAAGLLLTPIIRDRLGGNKRELARDRRHRSTSTPAPGASSGSTVLATSEPTRPAPAESPVNRRRLSRAEAVPDQGCTACRVQEKSDGSSLAGVTHRRTALWIENQILIRVTKGSIATTCT